MSEDHQYQSLSELSFDAATAALPDERLIALSIACRELKEVHDGGVGCLPGLLGKAVCKVLGISPHGFLREFGILAVSDKGVRFLSFELRIDRAKDPVFLPYFGRLFRCVAAPEVTRFQAVGARVENGELILDLGSAKARVARFTLVPTPRETGRGFDVDIVAEIENAAKRSA